MTNQQQYDCRLYTTSHQITTKLFKDVNCKATSFKSINIMGYFVCLKDSFNINIIVLEDCTSDLYFYVRLLNPSNLASFKPYCRYGYIFSFIGVDTTALTKNPKAIRLNSKDLNNCFVFECITNSGTDRFLFTLSKHLTISQSEWSQVEAFRDKRIDQINKVSIQDLNAIYLRSGHQQENITFMAQIVEIKQLGSYKMIVKIWDNTPPQFVVRLPANQATTRNDLDDFVPQTLGNKRLDARSYGKQVYVLILGQKTEFFTGRKPGDFILFVKSTVYNYRETYPNYLRIEVNDFGRSDSHIYQWIIFLQRNSNLGRLMIEKLRPRFVNGKQQLITIDESFESQSNTSNIQNIDRFKHLKENDKNVKIFCKIVDIFPINYTVFDLINISCNRCYLDDSVQNFFELDIKAFRMAANLHMNQYGVSSRNANCPNPQCSKAHEDASGSFKFFIIFLLEDKYGDGCIALFEKHNAIKFFDLKPLEILADEEKEIIFKNKLNYLLNEFNDLNNEIEQPRHMVIKKINHIFYIKEILIRKNLVIG